MSTRLYGSSAKTKSLLVNVANQTNGGLYITDTSAHAGPFTSISAVAASVASLASSGDNGIQGDLSAIVIPVGMTIYGYFTSVTLASGKVIAYN